MSAAKAMETSLNNMNEHNVHVYTSFITNDEIGTILASVSPIVENILKNLCIADLKHCGQVCKLWYKVSQVIRKQRYDIFRSFKVFQQKSAYHPSSRNCWISQNKYDIGAHFYDVIEAGYSEPDFVIMFCSANLFNRPQKYFQNMEFKDCTDTRTVCRKRKRKSKYVFDGKHTISVNDFLEHKLPRNCQVISCAATGIVGTPTDNSSPVEVESSSGLSAVFLPFLPGVEIFQFSISSFDNGSTECRKSKQEIAQFTGIPEDKNIKCLLVFSKYAPDAVPTAQDIIQHYLEAQNYQLALGGAVVDEIAMTSKQNEAWTICTALAFAGDNVQAASVVLAENVKTKQEVTDKLKQLKECKMPEDNCIAFMFACCGRGRAFYKSCNVEANAFNTVFPKVPLFGLFGKGEIGIDFLPRSNQYSNSSQNYEWNHGYTTIFVLLSLERNACK